MCRIGQKEQSFSVTSQTWINLHQVAMWLFSSVCSCLTTSFPVHDLSPPFVDVVAAMGDSVTVSTLISFTDKKFDYLANG